MAQLGPGESSEASLAIQTKNLEFLFEKVGKGAAVIGEVTDKMSSKKTEKAAKSLGGVFASMAKASIQGFIIEKLMILLGPFLAILDLFNPIFEVLAAIFAEALMPIMRELIPIIMLIVNALIQNKDIIIKLIKIALIPLMAIIGILMDIFIQLQPILDEIMEALEPLLDMIIELISEFFESEEVMLVVSFAIKGLVIGLRWLIIAIKILVGWIFGKSPGLIPGVLILTRVIEFLVKAIYNLINLAFTFLITIIQKTNNAIQMIINAIQWLVNLIVGSLIGGIDAITGALNAFANVLREVRLLIESISLGDDGGGGGGGGGLEFPFFDDGGIAVREGLFGVGKSALPELFIPNIDKFGGFGSDEESLFLQESTLDEIKILNSKFNRRRRRNQ